MRAWQEYLQRFAWQGTTVADYAPWHRLVAEGVLQCKSGALLRGYAVRGLASAGATQETQGMRAMQANDALKRLPGGWTVHAEARRAPVRTLPATTATLPVVHALDADYRAGLLAPPGLWTTQYTMVLTWTPPATLPAAPATFRQAADEAMATLRGVLAVCAPLASAALLEALKCGVSDVWHPVAVPEDGTDLDLYLCDADWQSGAWRVWDATLGTWHVRCCSLTGYPAQSWVGSMRALNALPVPYRWCTRWTRLDAHLQDAFLHAKQRTILEQEKTWMQKLAEGSFGTTPRILKDAMTRQAEDLSATRQEISADVLALGHLATTIVTWGTTALEADTHLRHIRQTLQQQGFVVHQEGAPGAWFPTHIPAWLATLPGMALTPLRQATQTTLTAAHLLPGLQAAWPGPTHDIYLQAAPWFVARTAQLEPFHVVNHVRDVGHYLVVGPTGTGKTVFLWWKVMAWMQYAGAQAAVFDKDKAGRLPTLLLGGHWYDLGVMRLQPLRQLTTEQDREWAVHWCLDLCEGLGVDHTGAVHSYMRGGLARLAEARPHERTLSGLVTVLADQTRATEKKALAEKRPELIRLIETHHAVLTALRAYTGGLLDGTDDTLHDGMVHTFEMGTLLEMPRLARPVLTYLYHTLRQRFSTDRPTLMPMDEAAALLMLPTNEDAWTQLLLEARKKSVSLGFYVHNLDQVFRSGLGPLLVSSCLTKYFLPDASARTHLGSYYTQMALNDEEIRTIAMARPNCDMYYTCEEAGFGTQLFELRLSRFALDLLARNTAQDHARMDRFLEEEGHEGFAARWMAEVAGRHSAAPGAVRV